ncbi:hypothetical protein BYT27DRAFT_7075291 [Phlegmacium glaucopus]|nr:hypothetical protein BYT27DRAFT_7075291 [Phlegmacium glaucopus]
MVRGQKKKSLTSRAPSATGRRKGTKLSTDSVALDENANSTSTPSQPKPRPKPRPIVPKPASVENGANEAAAACALVSLQNCTNTVNQNSPPTHRSFRHAIGPMMSFEASDEEDFYVEEEQAEEYQLVDELEDEVDELDASDSDSDASTLFLPTGSPVRPKLPEFHVPIIVPYRNASRDVDGITSKTPFAHVLRLLSERMEVSLTLLAGIGYIPSYKPKTSKPVPKLLEDDASWHKLLEDVHAFILACKGKNNKGTVKAFHINIVDTTALADSDPKVRFPKYLGVMIGYLHVR